MTFDYITIDTKAVTNEYLAKVRPEYGIEPKERSLIYSLKDDNYYTSVYHPDVWQELICKTQEEFIQKVQEYKLLKLLD